MPHVRRPGPTATPSRPSRALAGPTATLRELQQAFTEHHALQCGFCTPAMLLTAHGVPTRTTRGRPSEEAIREAIVGVTCRCTGYQQIVEAIQSRGGEGMTIEQHPAAREDRRRHRAERGRAHVARQEHQPRRGSALPPRRGPLPRRHQAPEHGARGDRAQPARARAHRLASTRRSRGAARRGPRRHRQPTSPSTLRRFPRSAPGPIVQDMIAIEKVRHYGEAVAAVIAEDRYIAEDACDLIDVEYEQLPVVLDPFEAQKPTARRSSTRSSRRTSPTSARSRSARSTGAFAEAPRKVQAKLRWPRSTGMPMDTNGAIGDYDAGTGVVTIHANSMNFTYFHWLIAGVAEDPGQQVEGRARRRRRQLRLEVLHAQGADLRRLPLDARRAAGEVRRGPASRTSPTTTTRGSDRWYDAELAFDDDGTFRALRIDCVDDYGAYLQFGTGTHGNALSQIVGPYRIQHVRVLARRRSSPTRTSRARTAASARSARTGCSSGSSTWPPASSAWTASRSAARTCIRPDEFPYRTPTGNIYDSGNYQAVLEKILELGDYDHWVAERRPARARGPPRRHRRRRLQRAQRLQLDRVLVLVRQAGVHADRRSPESASLQVDPTGPDRRHAPLAGACGATAPRPSSPRSSPRSSTSTRPRSSSPTPTRSTRSPGTGPGGSRFTVMVSGAVAGAAAEVKEKIKRIAADEARGLQRTISSSATAESASSALPTAT